MQLDCLIHPHTTAPASSKCCSWQDPPQSRMVSTVAGLPVIAVSMGRWYWSHWPGTDSLAALHAKHIVIRSNKVGKRGQVQGSVAPEAW